MLLSRPLSILVVAVVTLAAAAGSAGPARAGLDLVAVRADNSRTCPPTCGCNADLIIQPDPVSFGSSGSAMKTASAMAPIGTLAAFGSFLLVAAPPNGNLSLASTFAGGGTPAGSQSAGLLSAFPVFSGTASPLRSPPQLEISGTLLAAPVASGLGISRAVVIPAATVDAPPRSVAQSSGPGQTPAAVSLPEPASIAAALSGLPCVGGVLAMARRLRRQAAAA